MNFGHHINLNLHELRNAIAHLLGSNPGSPTIGQIWYNTATNKLMYRDNGGDRDITYLSQVLALRLDQFAQPTSDLAMNSRKITGLADGTSAQDAATYGQLLSLINGLGWKNAVRVVATSNITLSGTQTIDGVSLIVGDEVLVAGQSTASQNGIYVVASGAWTRRTDADATAEVKSGLAVFVTEGTTYGNTQWQLTTDNPITIGSTSLTFAQFGAGTSYTQGTGISISGNVVSIDTALIPRKFAATIGDGVAASFTLTHNFGTKDVVVSVMKISTNEIWFTDILAPTTNTVQVDFAVAPTTNEYRVTIHA